MLLVSICIPTYSRLHYLKQAVASAQAQTYSNIEICISQNPKKEGPDTAIKEWCLQEAAKGNLVYNLNKENLGLTGNLNVLAKIASGEYIMFLGDDDLLAVDFASTLIERLQTTNAAVGFTNQFFIDENGGILQKETAALNHNYKRDALAEGIIPDPVQLVFNNSVPLSASVIRRNLFQQYSFNEKLNTPELPFFLKVALDKHSFIYVNRQLAYYRLHQNSETSNGLSTDELLKDMLSIEVPAEYQKLKRDYIEGTIVPAINKALLKGNYGLAKFLLRSGYYPKKRFVKLVQELMSHLPLSFIKLLFRLRKSA